MENCNACKNGTENKSVPYIVYESEAARHERTVKRFIIAIVVAFVLIVLTNIAWLIAWNQYDYTSEETIYTQDGQGTNIIGNDNEVVNNGSEANN